jgi:hypothetical protein
MGFMKQNLWTKTKHINSVEYDVDDDSPRKLQFSRGKMSRTQSVRGRVVETCLDTATTTENPSIKKRGIGMPISRDLLPPLKELSHEIETG